MGRHSKRNTASASFTYAERQMLTDIWGSKATRIAAHSVRRFDMCCLCLAVARNPVVCNEGHLFCKECILDSLLQQSKDIAAQKAYLVQLDAEEQAARERAREQARSRILRQFEAEQSGVRKRDGNDSASTSVVARSEAGGSTAEGDAERHGTNLKRKAIDDGGQSKSASSSQLAGLPDVISAKLRQAEDSAMAQIEAEQREARRAKLPAFWLPSLTPSEVEGRPKDIKLQTLCRAGSDVGHKLKMKNLIEVKFTEQDEDENSAETADRPAGTKQKICPSCQKGLGAASRLYVVRPCGDVICSRCVDTILKPTFASSKSATTGEPADKLGCPACDKPLASSSSLDQAILALDREGTGYSAGGNAEVKKRDVAFQG